MRSLPRLEWAALAVAGLTTLPACGDAKQPEVGRDCGALLDAAQRARSCDPKLAAAATRLRAEPDEGRCRAAVRSMLGPPPSDSSALRSVHAEDPAPAEEPLTELELSRLRELPQPATLTLVPDVPPGPGVTRTRATVDGVELVADERGVLSTTILPGARTLQLHHGGATKTYCIELRACDPLRIKAHGSRLARHADVRPGAC